MRMKQVAILAGEVDEYVIPPDIAPIYIEDMQGDTVSHIILFEVKMTMRSNSNFFFLINFLLLKRSCLFLFCSGKNYIILSLTSIFKLSGFRRFC